MSRLWKKIERVGLENFPYYLEEGDKCYYARDYIAEGGYSASEANDLISNFKKPVDRKGLTEWQYKVQAINKFAIELRPLLNENMIVTSIPSSKSKRDPEYDSRLEDVLTEAQRLKPDIVVEYPIALKRTTLAAHHGGTRNPEEIYQSLKWKGLNARKRVIVLVDDVITSGAHFKACQRLIKENKPRISIIGIFWARTVWV